MPAAGAATGPLVALPLSYAITDMEVSSAGTPWLSVASQSGGGEIGPLVDGFPDGTVVNNGPDFFGLMYPKPDGGMWAITSDDTLADINAGGAGEPLGPITGGFLSGGAVNAQGDLEVLAGSNSLVTVGSAGIVGTQALTLPSNSCNNAGDGVALADGMGGSTWVIDVSPRCSRVFQLSATGTLSPPEYPSGPQVAYAITAFAPAPDGSLWVLGYYTDKEAVLEHLPFGPTTVLPAAASAQGAVGASYDPLDGSVWVTLAGSCQAVQVTATGTIMRTLPLPNATIAFGQSGQAWLWNRTKVLPVSAAALPGYTGSCSAHRPVLRIPDAAGRKTVSLAAIRRDGIEIQASRDAIINAVFSITDARDASAKNPRVYATIGPQTTTLNGSESQTATVRVRLPAKAVEDVEKLLEEHKAVYLQALSLAVDANGIKAYVAPSTFPRIAP